MFTKRSILVGLLVLLAARLVDASAGTGVTPFPGVYLLDDGIHRKVRNPGLDDWLAETMKLGGGFPFDRIVISDEARSPAGTAPWRRPRAARFPSGVTSVTLDFLSTERGELITGKADWGHMAYDPLNPTSLVVSRCTIEGAIPMGDSWSGGDFFGGGSVVTGTLPAMLAIGSSAAGQVLFYGQPQATGAACAPLGGLVETLTNTGFGDAVAFVGTQMWVNRTASLGNPFGLEGGFDVFDLSSTLTSVNATLVGSVEGSGLFEYYGAKVTELNGEYLVAGSPYYSPPRASAFGMGAVLTSTGVVNLGNFSILTPTPSHLGKCVQNAGDVNNDNYDDVLVCSDPSLFIVCGKTLVQAGGGTVGLGAVITQIDRPASGIGFGASVLANVDYNGDGVPDVVVTAPYFDPRGLSDAGRVYVYDGGAGTLLHVFDGRETGDMLGAGENAIIPLGDLGARDGRLDFAFLAPGHEASFFLTTTMVTYSSDIDLRPSNHPFPRTVFHAWLDPYRLLRSRFSGDR
jgi:hypothetical protein